MSEEGQNSQNESQSIATPGNGLSQEDVAKVAVEAARRAVEDAQKNSVSKEDLAAMRTQLSEAQEMQKRIRAAVVGEESEIDPLAIPFIKNTSQVINRLGATIEEQVINRVDEKLREKDERAQAAQAEYQALQQAAVKVLRDRPDIHGDEDAKTILDGIYRTQDASLSHEERLKRALATYDRQLEKLGSSAAQRIEAASSPKGSGAAQVAQSNEPDVGAIRKEEINERLSAWRKARHLD